MFKFLITDENDGDYEDDCDDGDGIIGTLISVR